MRLPRQFFAILILLGMAGVTQAEQFEAAGEYEIHYSAFNSSFLPPEVAQAYDIQRSKYRALLNVAVLHKERGGKKPVRASVVGTMKNLLGQVQDLAFTEIREGEAVYYIATFRFTDDELLRFDLQVAPADAGASYTVEFKQNFYAD